MGRTERIKKYRQSKPLEELRRKMLKARRKAPWTQEDLDYATARGLSCVGG